MRRLQATLVLLGCVSGFSVVNAQEAVAEVAPVWADAGKHEFTLYPFFLDLNPTYTREAGSAFGWTWHLREGFAVQASFAYGWGTMQQNFDAPPPGSTAWDVMGPSSGRTLWTGMAGIELTPWSSELTLNDTTSVLEAVVNSGIGIAETRHTPSISVLRSESPVDFPWIDTGLHPTVGVGLGARLKLSDAMAIRLEVRDVLRSRRVTTANGCDVDDLQLLGDAYRAGIKTAPEGVSSSCRDGGLVGSDTVPLAWNLVRSGGDEGIRHTVSITMGASFAF